MNRRLRSWRWLGAMGIALVAALLILTPALAQDGSKGNVTLDEDLTGNQYLFGDAVTVNGDVDGDLVVFGRSLTVNGTVSGDVLFAGSWLKINGSVDGDVRGASGMMILEKTAEVSGDLLGAGYAIEMQPGSTLGGQVIVAGGQLILENVGGDVKVAVGNLRINGEVGGDVMGSVDSPDGSLSGDPFRWSRDKDPDMPQATNVPGGLSFGTDGKINGNLDYESIKASEIPSGVVEGKTNFTLRKTDEVSARPQPFSITNDAGSTTGYFLSSLLVLTILGVLLQRFRPAFLSGAADTLRTRIAASFGAGVLGYLAFCGVVIVLFILAIILALPLSFFSMGERVFSALTLTGVGASTAFIVLTGWLAPLVVALAIGELVYHQIDREKTSPFLSLLIGLVIVLMAMSVPLVGRLIIAAVVATFGLGAIILMLWPKKPATAPAPAPAAAPAPAK